MRTTPALLLSSLLMGCGTTAVDDDTATSVMDCSTDIDDGASGFIQAYFLCIDAGADNTVQSDSLPPHESPYWDESNDLWVAWDDRGGDYTQNMNTLDTGTISFTIPTDPTPQDANLVIDSSLVDTTMGTSDYEYSGGPVGVALNGVSMFAAMAAAGADIYEEVFTFDLYEGHPAGSQYHYHWHSKGPLEVLEAKGLTTSSTPGEGDVEVYGMMCDGTVVLGCTELDGVAPDTSDFDAQNGHVHDLSDGSSDYFSDRYHTHVCQELGLFELFPEIAYYETTGCGSTGGGPAPGGP